MGFQCADKEPWRWFKQAKVWERLRSNWERRRKERWCLGFRFMGNHQLGFTFSKTQMLDPVFTLLLSCTTDFSPCCWWRGKWQRQSWEPSSGSKGTEQRATTGFQGYQQRSRPITSHLIHKRLISSCFFFQLANSLLHSSRKCHWTLVQGSWKEERYNVYCAFSMNQVCPLPIVSFIPYVHCQL